MHTKRLREGIDMVEDDNLTEGLKLKQKVAAHTTMQHPVTIEVEL